MQPDDWPPDEEPEPIDDYGDEDGREALTVAERNPSLCVGARLHYT